MRPRRFAWRAGAGATARHTAAQLSPGPHEVTYLYWLTISSENLLYSCRSLYADSFDTNFTVILFDLDEKTEKNKKKFEF